MVAKAGAGPSPIPHSQLTVENLSQAIRYCLSEEASQAAMAISVKMEREEGVRAAVQSFHRQLPLDRMRCDLVPNEPAVWQYDKSKQPIKLSKIAAEMLISEKLIESKHLKLYVTPHFYRSPCLSSNNCQLSKQTYCDGNHKMGSCVGWRFSSHRNSN